MSQVLCVPEKSFLPFHKGLLSSRLKTMHQLAPNVDHTMKSAGLNEHVPISSSSQAAVQILTTMQEFIEPDPNVAHLSLLWCSSVTK